MTTWQTSAGTHRRSGAFRFELRCYGPHTTRHAHDHHQLVLPVDGVLEMDIDGESGDVSDQRAAAIPAGRSHDFAASRDNRFLVLDSAHCMRQSGFWDVVHDTPFVHIDSDLRGLCEFVASRLQTGRLAPMRASLLGEMLIDSLADALGVPEGTRQPALDKAREYIERHGLEPIGVGDIARHAAVSESRLYALFRAELGTSPWRYLVRHRMQHAAWLIERSGQPLAQVAQAVGYADQSAFCRAFRRELGCTPGEVCRRHGARQQEWHNKGENRTGRRTTLRAQ